MSNDLSPADHAPPDLPTGQTLTFLFADLEGSTRLWEQFPRAMKAALARHDALLRAAVESSRGQVVKTTGDGLLAVFTSTLDGVSACLKAQQSIANEAWGETGPLRVRMGMHAGEAQLRAGDYYGPAVNRAARLLAAGHGGQVLLSEAAAGLVIDLLPEGLTLRDLGEHRLKDLKRPEHIYQLLHAGLAADFPPLATLDLRPNNLPAQATPLIGRETELEEIIKRLHAGEVRLLTLTGPGGIGKTRAALQAAAELTDCFVDGVYFVDLAPIQEATEVPVAIARTIGLRETSDRPPLDELKEQLRARWILLVLDNFEQVTSAAPAVAELLRDCPHLKLLLTSREALRVRGEYIFPIPPLALPDGEKQPTPEQLSQYEAVRLFIERAQAVKPDFRVTNENALAVAKICVRLDGLPLAIELAAARIRLFSAQALLDRLDNRLSLLRGGARDLPVRQQTLRDAIDWSYELLDRSEQCLFTLLAVFTGGCSFEAVEVVSGGVSRMDEMGVDVLDGLSSLVEKSLVRQVEQASGEPRLLMLETIREYAAERLEVDAAFLADAWRAHAVYYADFARRQWELLKGHRQEEAFAELAANIENVHAAWSYWTTERNLEQLRKLIDGLWQFYDQRGWYHAIIDLATDMLNVLSYTPSTRKRIELEITLQTSLARALLVLKGYTPEVEQAYTRALELSGAVGEIPQLAPVLRGLGSLYGYLGKLENAAQMAEKMLHLGERLNDASMRVEGRLMVGYTLAFQGDVSLGLSHLEKAMAEYDPERYRAQGYRVGNDPGVICLNVTAMLLWMQGRTDRALERSNEAVELAARLRHPYSMSYALFHTSLLHFWRREGELSRDRARAVLDIAEERDYLVWQAVAACLHGAALVGMGQNEDGLAQLIQGIRMYQYLKTPPIFWPMLLYVQADAFERAGKPEQGLAVIEDVFRTFGEGNEIIETPEFYRVKANLLRALSKAGEAEDWYLRALNSARRFQLPMLELRAAMGLCRLWQGQGKEEERRKMVEEVYGKFTEGFETKDLREAREILEAV